MAEIVFLAGEGSNINNLAGSGLGFYGGSFGASVQVGAWQQTTFITNAAGTAQGPAADNVKFHNAGSGIVGSATSGIALTAIPNISASLNVRMTHTSAVKTQNAQMLIFDRTLITLNASGVTTKVAELIHPTVAQLNDGSGDASWTTFVGTAGAPSAKSLIASPGVSGLRPNGAGTTDSVHDWFLAMSASPDTIGSKTQFSMFFSVEFL